MRTLLTFSFIVAVACVTLGAACSFGQAPGQAPGGNWPRQPSLGPGGVAGEVHDVNAPKNPNVISAETYLASNPLLAAKLQSFLPEGLPVLTAATGYAKLEAFALTLHAAHDLGIPFPDFKCAEMGGKYCAPESKAKGKGFNKALEMLKGGLSAPELKAAKKKAKEEAKNDIP